MRRRDIRQLWTVCLAVLCLATTVVTIGQSQDYINATLTERLNGVELRLGRLETALMGLVATVLANLGAHIMEIRSRQRDRQDG